MTKVHQPKNQEKEQLISLIIRNNMWHEHENLSQYTTLELEGILEYGDPRAFWRPEFSYEPIFYSDKNKSAVANAKISSKYTKIKEDLTLARKLGGFEMQNRIKRTLKSNDKIYDNRRKTIMNILDTLPEKFRSIKKLIIEDDLENLIEFCRDKYKQRIIKLLICLVEERAKSNGMYVSQRELLNHYRLSRKSLMKYRYMLKENGFLNDKSGTNIESANIAAENILFQMKTENIINERILLRAKNVLLKFNEKFPMIYRAREDLGVVIAILIVKFVYPKFTYRDMSTAYCEEVLNNPDLSVSVYQAVKRGEARSINYKDTISLSSK